MSEARQEDLSADNPPPSIEDRARSMGWKPQEEYRGPADGWRDATEFVRRGEEELPVMRERNRNLERKLIDVERRLNEGTTVISDLTERFRTSDERAYRRAQADLMRERERAVETGDKAEFNRVDAEITELARTAPKPAVAAPAPAAAQMHPDVVAWDQRNPWFRQNPDIAAVAQQIHISLLQTDPGLPMADNLERVTAAVRQVFPGRIPAPASQQQQGNDNPRRQEAAAVGGSTPPPGPQRASPRNFETMPKESKDAFHRYSKQMEGRGKPLSKEEWAGTYWEQFQEG